MAMEPLRIWGLGVQVPPGAPQAHQVALSPTSETSSVVVALVTIPKKLPRLTVSRRYSGRGMSYIKYTAEEFYRNHQS